MSDFFELLLNFLKQIFNLLNSTTFQVYSVNVSLMTIIGSGAVLSMIIAIFWKGVQA